jgi:arylsulfatase A-like enzyme
MHLWPVRRRYGFDEMVDGLDYKHWLVRQLKVDTFHSIDEQPSRGPIFSAGVDSSSFVGRPWPYEEDLHQTNWTLHEAHRFLRRRDPTCPFFLVVSLLAPHPPMLPPAFYFDRYLRMDLGDRPVGHWAQPASDRRLFDHGRVHLGGEILKAALAGYYGLVNHIDDQLNRLLADPALDHDDTIVVMTSDHGEMLGDHRLWGKRQPYEGSARIPLVFRLPGSYGGERGRKDQSLTCLEDVMPTLLELVGIEIPEGVDGDSLAAQLRNDAGASARSELHIECAPHFHALVRENYKFIWSVENGDEQLFDLVADPEEREDLSDQPAFASDLDGLRRRLIAVLADRPEGFVRAGRLQPGTPYGPLIPGRLGEFDD